MYKQKKASFEKNIARLNKNVKNLKTKFFLERIEIETLNKYALKMESDWTNFVEKCETFEDYSFGAKFHHVDHQNKFQEQKTKKVLMI